MTHRRVIFTPDDYWTNPPKEINTVSEQPDTYDTDADDDVLQYRGQLAALELCRAVAASDGKTAEAIYRTEQDHGLLRYLVAGLCTAAVSLNRTVVEQQDQPNIITEELVWASLTERSTTGLFGSIEIANLTGGDTA